MEGKFQTSFIPKKSGGGQPSYVTPVRTINFFTLTIIIIFATVVLLSAGVYGYKWMLNRNNEEIKDELSAALDALRKENIAELGRLDSRIETGKTLLGEHVALSEFFTFLSKSTLQNVRFTNFRYSLTGDQKITVSMNGMARNFSSLALQIDEFSATTSQKYIKGPVFSSYSLDKAGNVSFVFTAVVNPESILYKELFKEEQ
ncbi:hypothetical protein KW782_00560 [Candidatus Parcubacteria bacterium]|nr:hypothetical protein [Candidatus Parcubacteria bacterium]